MNSRFLIYGLVDPRDGEVRYIGKSTTGMTRPKQHRNPCWLKSRSPKIGWIKSLLAEGLCYEVRALEVLASAEDLDAAERFWIAQGRGLGWRLTNMTKGGDGMLGCPRSAETREKIARSHLGIRPSEETRRKLSEIMKRRGARPPTGGAKGVVRTPEYKRRMSEAIRASFAAKGRKKQAPASDAARVALSRAQGGRPFRDHLGNTYQTQREAERRLGIASQNIGQVLLGRRQSANGYRFFLIEEGVNAG